MSRRNEKTYSTRPDHNKDGGSLRAVFLDRDGTINDDPGYVHRVQDFKLLPGAGAAIAKLNAAGFITVLVTNQSGVARGIIDPKELDRIHEKMQELLAKEGARIDVMKICTHHPLSDCACRKPKAQLFFEAAQEHGISLSQSFMVGDRLTDLLAGKNAGCRAVCMVKTGHGEESLDDAEVQKTADFIGESLLQVADWIIKT